MQHLLDDLFLLFCVRLVNFLAALGSLVAYLGFNSRPFLLPAIASQDIAEGQHRIDVFIGPMHPRPFQAGFHLQFIAAFNDSTPDGPALRLKERVLHLGLAFL